ncbi:MAG: glycosyltransferase [Candidatus Bathyarchaeia archaeon]
MLSCSELGLGHASRLILLGKKLEEKGHELFLFSGGSAYELLKREFRNVYYCTPVAWYENARGISISASLLNILFPIPYSNQGKIGIKVPSGIETVHRYYDLRRNIKKIKPNLIVSDGDLHALRLAHRWKFMAVYVTNVIRPSYRFHISLIPGERFIERYVKKCSKIIVPDNPPPYTICEYNIGNLDDVNIKDKVEFVGSFIDMTPIEGMENHIFASISGPVGTKAKLKQILIPVLSELKIKSVVSLGEHGKRSVTRIGNCTIFTWLSAHERREFMANAKLVIFSGGHTTCFETIKHVKPSICIPTQPEQWANAKKMQDMGCSIIAENRAQLTQAIKKMEMEIEFYKHNVRKLNQYSHMFEGVKNAVKIIEAVVANS